MSTATKEDMEKERKHSIDIFDMFAKESLEQDISYGFDKMPNGIRMAKPVERPRGRTWIISSSAASLVAIATLFGLNMSGLLPSIATIALAILFSVLSTAIAIGVVLVMRRRIAAARAGGLRGTTPTPQAARSRSRSGRRAPFSGSSRGEA